VAFGDNVGDVDMLRGVGRGFLLGNAHPAAKALHPEQLPWPYARGIRECLNNVIGDAPGGAEVYG
jgi:hydroxymethylpyrimidine pyrophosphatase-like HAD family hydrolase